MSSSLKKNILLNGINTVSGVVFPIITFPYAARILLPDGIGAITFLNSIINYIILFTSLGIPMYAVKEVAKFRDDIDKRDKITIEIIILSTLLCIIGYVAVFLLAQYIPQIHKQASLFYVLSLSIVFTSIGVNWFYQGIEDFKFITIRAIVIRSLAALSLFLFVRNESDLLIYGIITVGSTVGNNIINFFHLHKHINVRKIGFRELDIARHVKPSLQVFILNLIISLYTQLNSIMLGFISGDEAVGYFTAGTKISHIGLTIIGSLSYVLLPRCSNLLSSGDRSGFAAIIKKSVKVTIALSLPMATGLIILAYPITVIFCGYDYLPSISVLYLNAPVIIFISLTNVMGIQILYPMDKVSIVILSVSGGALVNMALNFGLIPLYDATGAAVATLIAEFTVLLIQIISGKRFFPFGIRELFDIKYIVSTFIMAVAVILSILFIHSDYLRIIVGLSTGFAVYLASLLIMRDGLTMEMLKVLKRTLIKKQTS